MLPTLLLSAFQPMPNGQGRSPQDVADLLVLAALMNQQAQPATAAPPAVPPTTKRPVDPERTRQQGMTLAAFCTESYFPARRLRPSTRALALAAVKRLEQCTGRPVPQLIGRGKRVDLLLQARRVVELDDAVAVGRVGKLQVEYLGVILRLLEPVAGSRVGRLCLDDGDGEVGAESKDVVGPLTGAPPALPARHHDAPVGEGDLLVDAMRFILPARGLEFGHNIPAASISFVRHPERPIWVYHEGLLAKRGGYPTGRIR